MIMIVQRLFGWRSDLALADVSLNGFPLLLGR